LTWPSPITASPKQRGVDAGRVAQKIASDAVDADCVVNTDRAVDEEFPNERWLSLIWNFFLEVYEGTPARTSVAS